MPSITNPGSIVLPMYLSVSFRVPEDGVSEVRAGRVGAGEICISQISTRQIRAAQIGPGEIGT